MRRQHGGVPKKCRPGPSPRLMSGGGSSHCRHLGTALSAPTGCGYNANPKIPAKEGGVVANYIDEFIMFCVGLWMTGVGF